MNGWTPEIVKKLHALKGKAWSYTWIHRENSIYLNDIYDLVSNLAYSLSFFNGVILIFSTNLIYIRIFTILLSFGAGLIIFYIKNKGFPETSERHKIASSKFSSIYNNIDRQLSLDISQREHPLHYHSWITMQYDTLYGSAPDIDPPIIEEYIRKFARRRKVNPIEAAEYDQSESSGDVIGESITAHKLGDTRNKNKNKNENKNKNDNKHTNKNNDKDKNSSTNSNNSEHYPTPNEIIMLPGITASAIPDNKKMKLDYKIIEKDLEKGSTEPKNISTKLPEHPQEQPPEQSPEKLREELGNLGNYEKQEQKQPERSEVPPKDGIAYDKKDKKRHRSYRHNAGNNTAGNNNINKSNKPHINYEMDRFKMNLHGFDNMNMNTRCFIPEYEFNRF